MAAKPTTSSSTSTMPPTTVSRVSPRHLAGRSMSRRRPWSKLHRQRGPRAHSRRHRVARIRCSHVAAGYRNRSLGRAVGRSQPCSHRSRDICRARIKSPAKAFCIRGTGPLARRAFVPSGVCDASASRAGHASIPSPPCGVKPNDSLHRVRSDRAGGGEYHRGGHSRLRAGPPRAGDWA